MNESSILLIDKQPSFSSFSTLSYIKRRLGVKIGHAGTLDSFATGLLIGLTGSFTKLNNLFMHLDKRYIATIEFGKETTTLDPEGEVIATGAIPTKELVADVIATEFQGVVDQVPPAYSALHIQGERAHKRIRRGEVFEMPTRQIELYSVELISWEPPFATISVHCSKGTYIRSLARDIAHRCNTHGYLTQLRRTAIGPYKVEDAQSAEDLFSLDHYITTNLELLQRVPHMALYVVDEQSKDSLSYGHLPTKDGIVSSIVSGTNTHALLVDLDSAILAVCTLDEEGLPKKIISVPAARRV
jgi:tRNA pseudouridine55 synthase